jgi:mannose-6-phosphate isomerase-like protein (cupin superfamily)
MAAIRTAHLPVDADYISPGGVAEIRLLLQFPAGELTHVSVPPGRVSLASRVHPSSEWFYIVSGQGQLWYGGTTDRDSVVELLPTRSVRIAPATPMQYRAGSAGLEFVLAAIPQWRPEYHGTLPNAGAWPPTTPVATSLDTRGELAAVAPGVQVFDPAPDDKARSYQAPDGSHILTMGEEPAGGLAICTLDPGRVSVPVRARTVEEIWYVIEGRGEISRRQGTRDPWVDMLLPGTAVDIGTGITFQFRCTSEKRLRLLLLTLPRWPGADEAVEEPALATWR